MFGQPTAEEKCNNGLNNLTEQKFALLHRKHLRIKLHPEGQNTHYQRLELKIEI